MKLELKRQDFLKALQTTEKIAASKALEDIVNSIKLNANYDGEVTIEATDLKTTVKCKVSSEGVSVIEPGTAVLPLAVLGGMLKKYKCDTAAIEVKDAKGVLIAEGSKSKFPTVPVDNFPNVPESNGADSICEISASELSRIITEGACASSQPQEFPKYMGASLLRTTENGSLKVVSTDGKRLSVSESACIVSRNEDVLLPSGALKDLARQLSGYNDENVKILTDGPTVWFALESVEFSIRKIEAAFPDYERILSNEVYTSLNIPCDTLTSAVERVDVIAKTTIPHIMVMDLNPEGRLRLTARSPELGVAVEYLDAEITGSSLQIGFNAAYFLDGLKALGNCEAVIEFSSSEGQTRMKRKDDSSLLYMLMPSRLSQQDIVDDELNDSDSYNNSDSGSESESDSESADTNDDVNNNMPENDMPEGEPIF